MKIITFYNNEKLLIKKAASSNREAQQLLYGQYAPKMLGVCRQYVKDVQFAEDVMIKGFLKVFTHLSSYRHEGSFEGWIRKIMVRESISYLRKQETVIFDDEVYERNAPTITSNFEELDVTHIQILIDALPKGYKMVFMMYAVEGYKHSEIAETLGISESTSKSQLFKARRMLQGKLIKQNSLDYGTH